MATDKTEQQTPTQPEVTSSPAGSSAKPVRKDARHATEASGYRGDNPSTAGPGPTAVTSPTPENKDGQLNPSAPEGSNTTPELPATESID